MIVIVPCRSQINLRGLPPPRSSFRRSPDPHHFVRETVFPNTKHAHELFLQAQFFVRIAWEVAAQNAAKRRAWEKGGWGPTVDKRTPRNANGEAPQEHADERAGERGEWAEVGGWAGVDVLYV